ncbi:hypothetical protein DB346_01680 [Verrucomicrobia bacterium LW23]|nr:hypothetical protein DB346_01680 [Verrucomicrobia bacterium LW23]
MGDEAPHHYLSALDVLQVVSQSKASVFMQLQLGCDAAQIWICRGILFKIATLRDGEISASARADVLMTEPGVDLSIAPLTSAPYPADENKALLISIEDLVLQLAQAKDLGFLGHEPGIPQIEREPYEGGLFFEFMNEPRPPMPITAAAFTIGRHGTCGILLTDSSVSNFHCHLQVRNDCVFAEDLAATNGTFIDGRRILSGVLYVNSMLTVGSTMLRLVRAK